MEKKLLMPKLRPEMEKAVLCAWLKEVGDEIKTGEPVYEIETDKVVTQVESSYDGVLKSKLYEEGDTVDVLLPVALVEEKQEAA